VIFLQTAVLKKLGHPVMTNLYYNTIKLLLERTSSVLVDREAVSVSLKLRVRTLSNIIYYLHLFSSRN
jgi:hypothetical protein